MKVLIKLRVMYFDAREMFRLAKEHHAERDEYFNYYHLMKIQDGREFCSL